MNEKNTNNINNSTKAKGGTLDEKLHPTTNGETEVFIQTKSSRAKTACSRVDDVSLLSFISFSWMFPWMWRAFRGQLSPVESSAQWTCSIFDSANVNMTRLEHLWNEEIKSAAAFARPPSLFRAVLRFIRFRLMMTCLVFLFCIVFGFIGPTCLVRGLIAFTERPIRDETDGTPLYSYGFYLAFSILMVEMLRVLAYGATWAISYRTAIRARGALLALLFKRLMHAKSLRRKTPAEIVNLFANDGQRIFDALTFAPLVLVGPFVLIGGLVYLLFVIGVLSLLGIAVFFVFDIIQAVLGVTMVKFRNRAIAQTERRMALVGELIRCIKCIKLNGWEELFYNRVRAVRRAEQRSLGWAGYAQSLAVASGAIVPVVATIVMTLAIVLNGHDLRASDAFSAITVFFVMLFGIRMIPYGIRYLAEAKQALTKIEALLLFDPYDAEPQTAALSPAAATDIVIQMKQCTFAWDEAETEQDSNTNEQKNGGEKEAAKKGSVVVAKQQQNGTIVAVASVPPHSTENGTDDDGDGEMEVIIDTENGATKTATTDEQKPHFCLQDLSFNVHKGELVGICGVVGSGKSALLNALTGHLVGHDGRLSMSGTVALCGQQPCVLNTSVRENILFGQPMHFKRYYQAISAAQLTKDLEQLPENEQSKVSACKLSGGQRARIAIARSLFSNRDIYLFDDIFASVDKAVASKIFSAGIKEMLGNRTRLLVTGDPEYLSACDRVLFMHRGRVIAQGTHAELVTNSAQYRTLFSSYSNASTIRSVNGDTMQQQPQHSVAPNIIADQMANSIGQEEKAPITAKKPSVNSEDSAGTAEQNGAEEEEEHYGTKAIGKEIYMEYIRAGGGPLLCSLVIAAFILNVGANIFGTVWLKNWMRAAHSNHSATDGTGGSLADSPSFYINIYAFTLLVLFISGLLKALVFVKFTLTAATRLHNRMLRRVLYATAAFFHRTPSGRILNRFSKDMDEIDVKLPFSAEALLQGMFTCLGFIFMIIWTFPLFLVPCAPLFGLFLLFFLCFRAGIRCLKRVENVTRSPVFEHLTTSLDALPTIHAFGQTQRFVDQLKQHLDENSGALFLYHSAMRWQAVWLDLLVVGLTFFVSLFIVLLTGRIDPAEAGMAIAFAMQMSGIFQFAVRSQTELEAKLTSVERVSFYYKNIEVESDKDGDDPAELGPAWPQSGSLEFDHVILRYAPQLNPALSDVSFIVYSGQKVGIVGRTGSGKTSLCNALFRLYPIESGTIRLDGWDIERVGLRRLRRSMAIISQEPTLFAGTLRFNVDPEGGADDARILELFNRFGADNGLGNSIGLDFAVESGGRNLSAGQRQLVCMCRAMLRNVQIVVLDEATANVDIQTDERIQQSVRKEFADRTVLVITHRLTNVVTGLGRVLSMADGKLSDDNTATTNHRPTSTTSTELPKIVVDEAPPPPSSPSVDE
ncbi:hypothetical protein niasHT_034538 [Heterodera trifolii]|uniref:Uncharacterized protein n=1 Tax=Heterodera trifolii TaxID=157864 RepID=A0ABD2I858_9BILA